VREALDTTPLSSLTGFRGKTTRLQNRPQLLPAYIGRRRQILETNGGRAGTRTPDLLRVKKRGVLLRFHSFPVFAQSYTDSAHLLSFREELVWDVSHGLLEHFWITRSRPAGGYKVRVMEMEHESNEA